MSKCRPYTIAKRPTVEVRIGRFAIGGGNPVAVQTMTDVPTMDTQACVAQILRIREAGCRIVRLTARTVPEAVNFAEIRQGLRRMGADDMALVADVHFSPEIALTAAEYADKVRINPGNFKDPSGSLFTELVEKCRRRGAALRIGVNHGSLSSRIMERYGDTPAGMAESAMEMLRRCGELGFDQVVVSMKSSNARVMVHAYREIAARMEAEGMRYPLHLGVTEAGDGAEGRIKSAVGIASLLAEGIGDTIRVSLTEPPENEIPVATAIAEGYAAHAGGEWSASARNDYRRRESIREGNIGSGGVPLLYGELDTEALVALREGRIAVVECGEGRDAAATLHRAIEEMDGNGDRRPVIVRRRYGEYSLSALQLKAAAETGLALLDGLVDGLWLENASPRPSDGKDAITQVSLDETALMIMQAARARISRTEYIACPGCGRTLFELQSTLRAVRAATSHLTGLKIGVMGCIVNGPGEMADADYGYVGAGSGTVVLYKGRQPAGSPIPDSMAVEALIDLIRRSGDWRDPE